MPGTDQPEQEMMALMRRTPWYAGIGGVIGGIIGVLLACLLHLCDK